ncbi:TPA: phenylacetate--CoA ligase family protein [Candidatus Poribacteria bacterium]|nr:phenylacetate--CoA ligase family protein [Candidatus Poribacteria bacterium]
MRVLLTKHILFPAVQFLLKNRCWDYYKELEQTQWYSHEEIQQLQWKKLKTLLEYAYKYVPLYRQEFQDAQITPEDINTPDDLKLLPIQTKATLRENYPHNSIAEGVFEKDKIPNSTSGSTGSPFEFMMSRQLMGMRWGRYLRGNTWTGLNIGEKYLRIWGPHGKPFTERFSIGFALNMKELSAFGMDKQRMQEYVEYIKKYNPKIIEAYASAAAGLAMFINQEGITDVKVDAVITSGETLFEAYRREIEQAFNCKAFNRYGCREFGAIAHECSEHTALHLNAESFFIEFVEDEQTANTGLYKIVLTNLDNFTMPFIRYEIGDVGRPADKVCPCGRGLPLIAEPFGRMIDIVMSPSGRMVSVHYLTLLFGDYNEYVKGFQATQTQEDKLEVMIVPSERYNDDIGEVLRQKVQEHTGDDMEVTFIPVAEIPPSETGKRALLKSLVD